MRWFVWTWAAFGWCISPLLAEGWEPAKTKVVIAGVLAWQDPKIPPFPKGNRLDRELAEVLIQRGVPRNAIQLLLDQRATKRGILLALQSAAKNTPTGGTLIFYYAGHGSRGPKNSVTLANYEIRNDLPETGLTVEEIAEAIAANFQGRHVLFWADCCHSGGLAIAAKRLAQKKIVALCLTSADISCISTGNWTYTQTLIDCLKGSSLADRNNDGKITLDEFEAEVTDAMKYRESQPLGFANFGLPADWLLGERSGPAVTRSKIGSLAVGDFAFTTKPKPFPVRIVGIVNGQPHVEFNGYTNRPAATFPVEELQPIVFKRYPVGTELQIRWGDRWWPGKVLQTKGDLHLVTYSNYGSEWDEWVLSSRLKER